MRFLACFCLVFCLGCNSPVPGETKTAVTVEPSDDPSPETAVTAKPRNDPRPDLGTRKTDSDWPCFLGPTGNSVSSEKGLQLPWPKAGPRVVWQMPLAAGYSMPTISRGRLFLFDRLRNRARVHCFKSETGEHLWSFEYATEYEDAYGYNNGPRCSPVVDGDRVYAYGPEGMLHCLRVADGKLVWKVDTRETFGVVQNFFGVGSTPVVEGDLLIAQVGGSRNGDSDRGNGSGVVAFDKRTGKVKYKITDELASYASPVLATIDGRHWCFVLARGGLIAFNPADGKVDFHYPWRSRTRESVNASNPVVVGNKVFISECYGPGSALLEVKPGGYKVVWNDARTRDKALQCHWNTPIHVDGYLYGCSGRHPEGAELRCIELATGKVQWSEADLTRTSLLLVDGHFVCLGEDGTLRLLKVNPKKYDEVARLSWGPKGPGDRTARLKYPCWAAPILSHGLLYVRGNDRLLCLEVIPAKK
jgi:outer membrane protein assembly factor BamB